MLGIIIAMHTTHVIPGLLVSVAGAMAVLTLNIHHRGVRGMEVPDIVKQVFENLLSHSIDAY